MLNQQLELSEAVNGHGIPGHLAEPRGASSWADHATAAGAWERRHEAEWARIDQKLRSIAARRSALDAEEANLLRYAEELKLWRAFGFGSLLEYMERAMGYAPHTATERLRVARTIAELPLIADALDRGELAHSAVRELSRVAVPHTEATWLEAARGKSLREIEAMVSGHRPGDLPTDATEPRLHRRKITLEVSPETYDIWRKLHALAAEEHGQRLSDDELIPSVFRRAYGGGATDGKGAGSPAYKIAIKQCPDCKRAWQYSGGRDIEVDPVVAECAACDAIHLGSLDAATPERVTTTVTARKREQVLARDGYCCTVPGCRRNVGLDLHHIEYQSRGGGHGLGNLTTICDLHHKAVHFRKLVIRGTAPDHVTFEFRKPRDRRNVTDDDTPALLSPGSARPAAPTAPAGPAGSAAQPAPAGPAAPPAPVASAAQPAPVASAGSAGSAAPTAPVSSAAPTAPAAPASPPAPPAPTRAAASPSLGISAARPTWAPGPETRSTADVPARGAAGEPKPSASPARTTASSSVGVSPDRPTWASEPSPPDGAAGPPTRPPAPAPAPSPREPRPRVTRER